MLAVHTKVIAHDDPLRRDRDAGLRAAGRSRGTSRCLGSGSKQHPVPLGPRHPRRGHSRADNVDGAEQESGSGARRTSPWLGPGARGTCSPRRRSGRGHRRRRLPARRGHRRLGVLLAALRSAIGTLANVSVVAEQLQRIEPGANGVRVACALRHDGSRRRGRRRCRRRDRSACSPTPTCPGSTAPIFSGRGLSARRPHRRRPDAVPAYAQPRVRLRAAPGAARPCTM